MLLLGLGATALAALYLIATFFSAPKKCPYPPYGLVGLAVIATAELLLYLDVPPVTVFFTPIVWSGYILAIDAAIFSLRGRSLIRSEPRAFAWMAIFSVFLWLIFELYNLRLKNWTYVGLPPNQYLRYLGYGWSFATILPAILETAEFLLAGRFLPEAASPPSKAYNEGVPRSAAAAPHKPPAGTAPGWIVFGLVLLIVPVLVPPDWGAYLFGSVWLGFIFLIDPLNQRAGRPSVSGDFRQGYRTRLWALMLSGTICGFLWEFWNYWASAKWLYVFPILESWRIFDMPLPGFLGFPLFAVELFAMYVFAASKLGAPLYETRASGRGDRRIGGGSGQIGGRSGTGWSGPPKTPPSQIRQTGLPNRPNCTRSRDFPPNKSTTQLRASPPGTVTHLRRPTPSTTANRPSRRK